ncbi:MAG: YdeI/OmpD-associated family protein, partial [Dehalococcoidia bacterium]|nr:YdeI/OmpD-associated family protein [Dehalococcoidia bacterium]
ASARANWEAFSPSIRKQFLWWIKSAKRETTRTARIEGTVRAARENVRVPGRA